MNGGGFGTISLQISEDVNHKDWMLTNKSMLNISGFYRISYPILEKIDQ